MKPAWPVAMGLALGLHLGAAVLAGGVLSRPAHYQSRLTIRFEAAKPAPRQAGPGAPAAQPPVAEVQAQAQPVPRPVPRPRPRPGRRPRTRATKRPLVPAAPPKVAVELLNPSASPGSTIPKAESPRRPEVAAVVQAPAPLPDLGPARGRLLAAVGRHKRYPRRARRLRQQGVIVLQVKLTAAGSLLEPAVVLKSSGHRMLDDEALRMIRVAAPFDRLPPGYRNARFEVPIRFSLK